MENTKTLLSTLALFGFLSFFNGGFGEGTISTMGWGDCANQPTDIPNDAEDCDPSDV